MKIFISWAGKTGHRIATALGDWIPSVIQAAETYVPPEETRTETGWMAAVLNELARSSFGILCIVPGEGKAPWMNFEAGVLSQHLDVAKVIPLLVGVDRAELAEGPLAQFPSAAYEKAGVCRIVETINASMVEMKLSADRLRSTFDLWWPKLEMDMEAIGGKKSREARPSEKPQPPRNGRKAEKPREPAGEPEAGEPAGKEPAAGEPAEKEPAPKAPAAEKPAARDAEAKRSREQEPPASKPATPETARIRKPEEPAVDGKPKPRAAAQPVLGETEIEILKVLADPTESGRKTAIVIGETLDISAQRVKEHLGDLERRNFVREYLFVGRPNEFSIAPTGKEYLKKYDVPEKRKSR